MNSMDNKKYLLCPNCRKGYLEVDDLIPSDDVWLLCPNCDEVFDFMDAYSEINNQYPQPELYDSNGDKIVY